MARLYRGAGHNRINKPGSDVLQKDGCSKRLENGDIVSHVENCENCPYPDCVAVFECGNVFVFSETELRKVMSPTMRL